MVKKQFQTPRDGAFWEQHIKSWKKSGMSQAKYCEQKDLRQSTFGYWHRKLGSLDSEVKFVKLPAATPVQSQFWKFKWVRKSKLELMPSLILNCLSIF